MVLSDTLLEEGLSYAEQNFCSDTETHLRFDKNLIKENFDLTGKKILDFGCGMGSMLLWYRKNWDCTATGIDIDRHHIKVCEELIKKFNFNDIRLKLIDLSKESIDESFDFISMNDVIEHLPIRDIPVILKKLETMLTPGGTLFISYPPWEGPYASHVDHAIGFPWGQYLPERLLLKLIQKNNLNMVGELESNLEEAYLGLNKINHKKLMQILETHTNLIVKKRKSHSIINRIPLLRNLNVTMPPFHFLITKEFLFLQKD